MIERDLQLAKLKLDRAATALVAARRKIDSAQRRFERAIQTYGRCVFEADRPYYIVNKYPAICSQCCKTVRPGMGFVERFGDGWRTKHIACEMKVRIERERQDYIRRRGNDLETEASVRPGADS